MGIIEAGVQIVDEVLRYTHALWLQYRNGWLCTMNAMRWHVHAIRTIVIITVIG